MAIRGTTERQAAPQVAEAPGQKPSSHESPRGTGMREVHNTGAQSGYRATSEALAHGECRGLDESGGCIRWRTKTGWTDSTVGTGFKVGDDMSRR